MAYDPGLDEIAAKYANKGQANYGSDPGLDEIAAKYRPAAPAPVAAPQPAVRQNTSALGDVGTALKIGVEQIPSMTTGLLDIPVAAVTGRPMVSEGWDEIGKLTGFRPSQWAKEAQREYSPTQQQFLQDAQSKEGFVDTVGHYVSNPLRSAVQGVESVPSMLAGGVLGRAGALSRFGAATRAGIGEGAVMAGQDMQQMLEDGVDPRKAALAATVIGGAGGALGALGGRAATKLGLSDPDIIVAGGGRVLNEAGQKPLGLAARVAGGAISEGLFEEAPQSAMEQMVQNIAAGKDPYEGVGKAAGAGAVIGGLMGGAFNVPGARRPVDLTNPNPAPTPSGDLFGGQAQEAAAGSRTREEILADYNHYADLARQAKLSHPEIAAQAAQELQRLSKELKAAGVSKSAVSPQAAAERAGELDKLIEKLDRQYEESLTSSPDKAEGLLKKLHAAMGERSQLGELFPTNADQMGLFDTQGGATEAPRFGEQFFEHGGRDHKFRQDLNNAQSLDDVEELLRAKYESTGSSKTVSAVEALYRQVFNRDINQQGVENGSEEAQPVREVGTQGNAEVGAQGVNADAQSRNEGGDRVVQGQDAAQGHANDEERGNGQGQESLLNDTAVQQAADVKLPKVQQKVFDYLIGAARENAMDQIVDGEGTLMYDAIGKATGLKRGSVKAAVDGAVRNIAAMQGVSVEQFKAALRARSASVRTTESAASEALGLQPAAQSSEVELSDVFGENGNTPSMEIVASPGQTNANAGSDAMDEGNKEGTEWLKRAGELQGRNALAVRESPENPAFVQKREAEARANAAKPVTDTFDFSSVRTVDGVPIQPVDVENAAQEYDEDLLEGDVPFAQLSNALKLQWVKVWIAKEQKAINAQQLMRTYTEIVDEANRAAKEGRRLGEDQSRLPAEGAGRVASLPAEAEAGTAEEGLTADEMAQQWDAAAQEAGYVPFAELSDAQRNYILGSATWQEFNDAAQEVAGELSARYSESAATEGSDAATISAKLKKFFLSPMRFDALVTIVQSQDELPADARGAASAAKGKVQGFVMKRRVYLIADHIAPGKETAVLLHELGVHLGMKELLGQANFSKLVGQVRNWAKTTGTMESRLATKALLRAVKSSSQSDEEVIAYFIEEAVNAGINPTAVNQGSAGFRAWFRTLWAAAKSALRKIGLSRTNSLTAQNMVDLAYGAAQLELHGTWHGTAANFRRFDHGYMNSGEGAQAFGWGTYLAQRYGIAKGYFEADVDRKRHGGSYYPRVTVGGQLLKDRLGFDSDAFYFDVDEFPTGGTGAELKAAQLDLINTTIAMYDNQIARAEDRGVTEDVVDRIATEKIALQIALKEVAEIPDADFAQAKGENVEGSLMRVVPQVEPDELLDWDKPLSEQSDKVKAALESVGLYGDSDHMQRWAQTMTGSGFYQQLAANEDRLEDAGFEVSDKGASEYLDALGIKGIQFLDAQSRTNNGRNTMASFPQFDELTRVLTDNDFLGFESRSEALRAVLQDGMADMRRNFDLPPDLDALLDGFVKWMKAPPEAATRNLVIFNDRNVLRVATRVAADANRVQFSEAPSVTQRIVDTAPDALKPQLKKFGISVREAFRTALDVSMFTEDLVRKAKAELPSAVQWYNELAKRETTRMAHKARVDEIAVEFDQLERSQFSRTWKLIHDMTSQQAWGYKPNWKSDVQVDPELAQQYNELTPHEQRLVNEVFQHGDTTIKRIQQILDDTMESERQDALARARNDKERKKIERDFAEHKKLFGRTVSELAGPYSPMRRVGSHVVVAKSQAYLDAEPKDQPRLRRDPAHYRVEFYDSLAAAQTRADELKAAYAFTDAAIKEKVADNEGLPFEAFDKLRKMIAAEGGDGAREAGTTVRKLSNLLTELYLTSLAETSARKSELRRDRIGGMEVDQVGPDAMYRAFLSKGTADAHYIGTLTNGRAVSQAFNGMRREANREGGDRHSRRRLFNELATRYDNSLKYDASPLIGKLMNLGSVWMLLTKPAYFFYNATQPILLTQPALAQKHGYAKSGGAMLKAYGELVQLKSFTSLNPIDLHTLPADVRDAVLELRDRGRIDITITQDLGERIHGATSTVGRSWQWAERKMKGMAQKVETTNRVVSAMAAYRLAIEAGQSHDAAVQYASDIIYDTHGDYSNLNAPRLMNQSQAMRLLTQFRKFQFIQIGQLVRMFNEAKAGRTLEEKWALSKAFRYTLAHHAVLAGAMGLPAASIIAMAMSAGADDDEPFDLEAEAYKRIGDKTVAALLLHGVPAALNLNLSRNVGMGQAFSILPFADVGLGEKGGYEKLVTAAMGPVVGGLGAQFWDAVGSMQQGDAYKGMEAMLPSGLRAVAKSFREALKGVENRAGDTLVKPEEIDAWATMLKVAGFRTEDDTVRQLLRGAQYEYEKAFHERTTTLKKQYRDAYRDNDAAAMGDARANWLQMQQARRMMGFKLQPLSELLKAPMEQRKRERNTAFGVQYNTSNRRFVQSLGE